MLLEIRNITVNLQWLKTSGLDIEAAYSLPLSDFGSCRVPISGCWRPMCSKTSRTFWVVTDRVGETGGTGSPDWYATFLVGYTNGPFQGNVNMRYISSGV